MKTRRKRNCKHCGRLYRPDPRTAYHQRHCSQVGCQRARHQANQREWCAKAENRNYFRGPDQVERVRTWRKAHPGYWRKKADALQDEIIKQPAPPQGDSPELALQDVISMQPALLVGVISTLMSIAGDALQDEIAPAIRHLHHRGQMILDPRFGIQKKGKRDAGKTFVMSG